MVSIAPHERLVRVLATGQHILPVLLSELGEIEASDSAHHASATLVLHAAGLQVFLREIHALELVEEADVPQISISRARN